MYGYAILHSVCAVCLCPRCSSSCCTDPNPNPNPNPNSNPNPNPNQVLEQLLQLLLKASTERLEALLLAKQLDHLGAPLTPTLTLTLSMTTWARR